MKTEVESSVNSDPLPVGRFRTEIDDILRLAQAQLDEHNYIGARQRFREAADRARRIGADDLLIRAALGAGHMGAGAGPGIVDHELIALIQEALDLIGDVETAERAILTGRMAVDLYWSQRRAEAIGLARTAVEMARRLGDLNTLMTTLYYRNWMLWGPENLEQRLAVSSELIRLAEGNHLTLSLHARVARLSALLEMGEIHEVDAEIAAIENLTRHLDPSAGYVERFKAMRTLMRGEFDEAQRWLALAAEIAQHHQDPILQFGHTGQYGHLLTERGRAEDLLPALTGVEAKIAELPVVRMAVGYVYALCGRLVQARTEFEYLAVDDFARIPDDWNWLGTIAHLSEICVRIGDFERAPILRRILEPYAGRSVTLGWGEVYYNAVSFYLGMLSTELREFDRAQREFEAALRFNRKMGAGPALARAQAAYARMLLIRGDSLPQANALIGQARKAAEEFGMRGLLREIEQFEKLGNQLLVTQDADSRSDHQYAVFIREKDVWLAEGFGQSVHLRPMKGFEAIRYLLSRPGEAVSITELGRIMDPADAADRQIDSLEYGDAGPMLDVEARNEYRDRLRELRRELDQAQEFNDLGRVATLSKEMEFLEGELRRAVGLGGRERRASSASERLRIRVTNSIRAAVSRIQQYHPRFGAHLTVSIKTGSACYYRPDPNATPKWKLYR
jgi:tetratricopeptide (TPR) repeat protein